MRQTHTYHSTREIVTQLRFSSDDTVHHFPIPECHAFWYWYKFFIANHALRVIKNSFFIFNSARLLTFGGTETFLSPERCAYLKEGD